MSTEGVWSGGVREWFRRWLGITDLAGAFEAECSRVDAIAREQEEMWDRVIKAESWLRDMADQRGDLYSRLARLEGEARYVDIRDAKTSLDRIGKALEKHGIAWNTVGKDYF